MLGLDGGLLAGRGLHMRYFPWGLRRLFAKPFHLPFEK